MIVYRHRRLDNFNIFCVGIGKKNERAYNFNRRNKYWQSIKNKTEILVEIIAENLSEEDAKELEVLLISEYGRKDRREGLLSNMTDGGDGTFNFSHSEETKIKMSKSGKNRIVSIETRNKLRISNSGINHPNYGKHLSEVTREKLKESKLNEKHFNARKVTNNKSKEIFGCIKLAAESIKMKPTTLRAMLKGQNKNKTDMTYLQY